MFDINFYKYLSNCAEYIQELRGLLSEDDVKELADVLKDLSFDKYLDWSLDNVSLIESFLLATPSQRKQKKYQKIQRMTRLALILACIQRAEAAYSYLSSIQNFGIDCPTAYRQKLLDASQAYFQAWKEVPNMFSFWPFEDICESPFLSDS